MILFYVLTYNLANPFDWFFCALNVKWSYVSGKYTNGGLVYMLIHLARKSHSIALFKFNYRYRDATLYTNMFTHPQVSPY